MQTWLKGIAKNQPSESKTLLREYNKFYTDSNGWLYRHPNDKLKEQLVLPLKLHRLA